jgi:NAD(P)-dependent dehydrogenase (short-subunit alcohol dehydrogenase family)
MKMQVREFINKVVIGSGAGHGIGRCIAQRVASKGANIIIDGGMTRKMIYEP